VVPDLLCLGKGLTSGFPLSACVGTPRAMGAWGLSKGEALHTSTFLVRARASMPRRIFWGGLLRSLTIFRTQKPPTLSGRVVSLSRRNVAENGCRRRRVTLWAVLPAWQWWS
jgi:hypothetical protein